jgi:mannose-1-phosphate guanylyltransferase/phosphomannomutase
MHGSRHLKAVVMGGGQGSRLRPLTCHLPKPMVPVCNKPVMEYCLELLQRHKVTHVYVTLHYLADEVIAHFGNGSDFGLRMHYSVEQEPMGTAGSVRLLKDSLDSTFFVVSGDSLTDIDLQAALRYHQNKGSKATLVLTRVPDPLEFGVVVTNDDGAVQRFLEKPTWGEVFSDTVNTGIYILEPEVLELIPPNQAFDFSSDLFPIMLEKQMPLYGYVAEGYWCDVGTLEKYHEAHLDLMSGKVDLELPGTVLRRDIHVGKGTRIHPGAQLEAPLVIGKNCRIREGARLLEGTVLGDNCIVEEGATLHRDVVWEDTFIGRKVRSLGSIIGRKVTLKANSVIGEGSVVSDDVTIGEGATVHPQVKIWPKKNVEPGGNVSLSLVWGQRWPSSMFGREGIVGLGNIEITSEFALKLGAAYGSVLPKGSVVTMSREFHPATRMINRSLICGLISVGVQVADLRIIPSPVSRYVLRNTGAVGGIHCRLAKDDVRNLQIQFFDERGVNIGKATERKIENSFFREEFRRTLMDEVGTIDFPARTLEQYTEAFAAKLDLTLLREAGFKVVVDYGSGGGSTVLPQILGKIGCESVSLNAHLDPNRSREQPFDSPQRVGQLCDIVTTLRADLGVSLDPEGERMMVVDDKGQPIDGITLLIIMTILISQTEPGALIAAPVSAPSVLESILKPTQGRVVRTGVDLRSLMHRSQLGRDRIRLAGTAEGELFTPDFSPGFDAMFCFVKLLELMSRHKVALSEVRSLSPKVHHLKMELPCASLEKGRLMRRLLETMKNRELEMTDGLKILYPGGWVLVVPAPSRPSLMLWSEGQTPQQAQEQITSISQVLTNLMEAPTAPEEMLSVTPSLTHQNPTLPEEKAFHFWNAQRYLGVRARTFSEFLDTLHYIEASSLTYHFRRGDFSNWVEHELHDQWLADQIRLLEADPDRLDSLRSSLVQLLSQSVHHRRPEEAAQERKESETTTT